MKISKKKKYKGPILSADEVDVLLRSVDYVESKALNEISKGKKKRKTRRKPNKTAIQAEIDELWGEAVKDI